MMTVPRSRFPLLSLLAAILFSTCAARADWSLTTADFSEQHKLTINTWDADGLSITGQDGNLVKVQTRDVVTLTSDRHLSPPTKPWRLALRNGDILYGEPIDISGQSLDYKVAELGPIAVPLKLVQSLSLTKTAAAPYAASDKDTVQLTNGDQMQGIVATISADKLQISTGTEPAGGVTDIILPLIQQISFGGAAPAREIPPLSARLTFISGSVLTAPLSDANFAWTINDISFTDPAGQIHKTTADQLAAVEVLGGRVAYLTEMDPATDQQTSFIGASWPTQINKNVLGRELTVAKTTYARGIGVHTRSLLAYDLDGSFETLKLRVGMDDSASPHGEADIAILLDGKILWQKPLHCAAGVGEISEELSLPLHGGKHLELRANPVEGSGKLDILGRVDWLNVALIRP
jgi:hypothetical protein